MLRQEVFFQDIQFNTIAGLPAYGLSAASCWDSLAKLCFFQIPKSCSGFPQNGNFVPLKFLPELGIMERG